MTDRRDHAAGFTICFLVAINAIGPPGARSDWWRALVASSLGCFYGWYRAT
jgi:hypothetical protein